MELNITEFFNEACPKDYSASVAEIGQNAGAYTWRAACDDSEEYNLLDTEEKREAFRVYVKGFGAWDDEEIKAWTDVHLNALCIQMVSGDIRESGISEGCTWEQYYKDAEEGRNIGHLSKDDGNIYYYIGE